MKPIVALRHVPHEGLGSLEEIFRERGLVYEVLDLPGNAPRTFQTDQLAGLVVLGGPMNVDDVDRHPFLADEVGWIQQAVAARLPVLGVCLGSQLLAKALGSDVYPNRVKEIGWYSIDWTPEAADDAIFAGCAASPHVFQWHGDTFDLPRGAALLASSPLCRNQAFRFGDRAYGLQFHIEVTAPIIGQWFNEPGNCGELAGLDYIDPPAILATMPERLPALTELGRTALGRWADLCRAELER
ncbi:MAG: gamma-glutamyl-gamma-aminobutyrate hydrolase family protein [Pirellulales bacterium]